MISPQIQPKKFKNAGKLTIFKKLIFELVQALGKYEKSHRFDGGCSKWWGITCYFRANVDELRCLTKKIKFITLSL